jgi:hypothetical protein
MLSGYDLDVANNVDEIIGSGGRRHASLGGTHRAR